MLCYCQGPQCHYCQDLQSSAAARACSATTARICRALLLPGPAVPQLQLAREHEKQRPNAKHIMHVAAVRHTAMVHPTIPVKPASTRFAAAMLLPLLLCVQGLLLLPSVVRVPPQTLVPR